MTEHRDAPRKSALPQLDGVLETALYVDDLERSAQFYQSVLGFEPIFANDRLIALSVVGKQVLLLFRKGASASHTVPHDGDGRLHLAFAIPTAALDSWRNALHSAGVPIEAEQTWNCGGQSLYFRDLDGHLLELVTPGVWSIY